MSALRCPSAQQLAAFQAGKLRPEESQAIASHLEACASCQTAIQTGSPSHDARPRDLQSAMPVDSAPEAPPCQPTPARPVESAEDGAGTFDYVEQTRSFSGAVTTIGKYEIVEQIGAGGMGMVFKARNTILKKMVALKILHANRVKDPQAVARFRREIEASGQLEHPNIVRALDADYADGQHFLIMEWLVGQDLQKVVRKSQPLTVPIACEYIRQAALGLEFAHRHHMVHRDVKPSNLLRTQSEEGKPVIKVLDLGLALLRDSAANPAADDGLTCAGQVMGTYDFIAPEQARETHAVDARADIYSLGCTFYFLLTGRAPFHGKTEAKKLLAHQLEQPESVSQFRKDIPEAVETIVRKMMEKDPAKRFEAMQQVVDAIERLRMPPFQESPRQLGGVGADRRKWVIPAASILGVLAVIACVVGLFFFRPSAGDVTNKEHGANKDGSRDAQANDLDTLFKAKGKNVIVFDHPAEVHRVAISPQGTYAITGCKDGSLHRIDLTKGEQTPFPKGPWKESVVCIAFLSTTEIMVCHENNYVSNNGILWKLNDSTHRIRPSHKPSFVFGFPRYAYASKDGKSVVVSRDRRNSVGLTLEWANGELIDECLYNQKPLAMVFGPTISADGSRILADHDRSRNVWDRSDLSKPLLSEFIPTMLNGETLARGTICADGKRAAFTTARNKILVWDFADKKIVGVLEGHDSEITSNNYAAEGNLLVTGSRDGSIRVWDLHAMKKLTSLERAHAGVINQVILSPDGNYILSASSDKTMRFWKRVQ